MLAGFNRRKRRQSHSFQSYSKHFPRNNNWKRFRQNGDMGNDQATLTASGLPLSTRNKVAVDESVMKAMQLETASLLRDRNPCSLYALAAALQDSKDVMNLHQEEEGFLSQLSHMSLDRKQQERNSVQELKKALASLEASIDSHSEKISSWEDAEKLLSTVLEFPDTSKEAKEEALGGSFEKYRKHLKKLHILGRIKRGFIARDSWKPLAYGTTAAEQKVPEPDLVDDQKKQEEEGAKGDQLDKQVLELLKEREARLESEAVKEIAARAEAAERAREAEAMASSLLRPLTSDEQEIVREAIYGMGPGDEILAELDADSVRRESMRKLKPGTWLNDEVIHYFYVMLSKRDEEMCRQDSTRKRSHFFKSFFMTKLLNEGSLKDGQYEYSNVKRWSKKVPGKDIFKLDKIVFPINQGQAHWICAVVYMTEKRIQMYDSMGSGGMHYLESLFRYLQDEHQSKKGSPLPDLDDWELVPTTPDTPHQRNGFDCGVFTCMFADFLSKDCPLVFSQEHITQCRERIALSIMNGSALM